jgi:hypothetical protein
LRFGDQYARPIEPEELCRSGPLIGNFAFLF